MRQHAVEIKCIATVKVGGQSRNQPWQAFRRVPLLLIALVLSCWLAAQSSKDRSAEASKKAPAPTNYVGDEACRSCHQEKVETYLQTAHHLTTSWPGPRSVKGSFTPGSNTLKTANPYLHFEMTTSSGAYLQSAIEEPGPGKTIARTERIDLVTGSGRKGQTYMFWKGDQLFQLPVSYWTETNNWVNSPGFPDGSPHFDKEIIPRCLECHASSFAWMPPPSNRYRKTSLVLGITCEKCHGPDASTSRSIASN